MGIDIAADRKDKENAAKAAKRKKQRQQKLSAGIEAFKEGLKGQDYVCTQCGEQAKPVLITKGSIFIEIILWLCLLIPGLIYSIWRHSTRFRGCPDCRTQTMVKADSPIGKKLLT